MQNCNIVSSILFVYRFFNRITMVKFGRGVLDANTLLEPPQLSMIPDQTDKRIRSKATATRANDNDEI